MSSEALPDRVLTAGTLPAGMRKDQQFSVTTRRLEPKWQNVRLWLQAVLTAPDKQRPLFPQQRTFQPPLPLSHHLRLLLGDKRTYGRAVCRVRD